MTGCVCASAQGTELCLLVPPGESVCRDAVRLPAGGESHCCSSSHLTTLDHTHEHTCANCRVYTLLLVPTVAPHSYKRISYSLL